MRVTNKIQLNKIDVEQVFSPITRSSYFETNEYAPKTGRKANKGKIKLYKLLFIVRMGSNQTLDYKF